MYSPTYHFLLLSCACFHELNSWFIVDLFAPIIPIFARSSLYFSSFPSNFRRASFGVSFAAPLGISLSVLLDGVSSFGGIIDRSISVRFIRISSCFRWTTLKNFAANSRYAIRAKSICRDFSRGVRGASQVGIDVGEPDMINISYYPGCQQRPSCSPSSSDKDCSSRVPNGRVVQLHFAVSDKLICSSTDGVGSRAQGSLCRVQLLQSRLRDEPGTFSYIDEVGLGRHRWTLLLSHIWNRKFNGWTSLQLGLSNNFLQQHLGVLPFPGEPIKDRGKILLAWNTTINGIPGFRRNFIQNLRS